MAIIRGTQGVDYNKFFRVSTSWMELVIADYFGTRQNIIVPNISWGLNSGYEKDLLVLRPSGWALEVEIKISKSDLKADMKKTHGHHSGLMKELYFAIPEKLHTEECLGYIPERAGVLVARKFRIGEFPHDGGYLMSCVRPAERNLGARKLSAGEIHTVLRLGTLRYWRNRENMFGSQIQREAEKWNKKPSPVSTT